MTDAQRQFVHVAKAFAKTFVDCAEDEVEVCAMQLHAALQDLAHVYEGEMLGMIKDEDLPFFAEEEYGV